MPKVYLLSRTLDPILAVFTGLFAYHLSENNPRSNVQPGHTLRELIPWQWNQWKAERRAREIAQEASAAVAAVAAGATTSIGAGGVNTQTQTGDVDWAEISKALEGDKPKAA